MKKLFLFSLILLSGIISLWGQSNEISIHENLDYSKFEKKADGQTWRLLGIASNEKVTAIGIRIILTSNRSGSFYIPDNVYLYGDFGTTYPFKMRILDREWNFGSSWEYNSGHVCPLKIVDGYYKFNI